MSQDASSSPMWLAEQHDFPPSIFECSGCLDGVDRQNETFGHPRPDANKHFAKTEFKETEEFLAAEMNKLSFQERSKAMDDVHCVGDGLEENEELIRRSLTEFDEQVKAERNPMYELASSQDTAFVENEAFRLKFLRATLYDVKKSVQKMMNFLTEKATYFGEDKVGRDIVLSDLNEADLKLLRSGAINIQKSRDRSGRVVVFVLNHLFAGCTAETVIRVSYFVWYNLLVTLPEVQKKGLVYVYFDTAKPGEKFISFGLTSHIRMVSAAASIPYRYTGFHVCLRIDQGGSPVMNNSVIQAMMTGFPRYFRVRARIHYGSAMELLYRLQGHGVQMRTGPVDSSGKPRHEILTSWYAIHLGYMRSKGFPVGNLVDPKSVRHPARLTSTAVLEPVIIQPTDVLLGRGKGSQDHPGNIRFRKVLDGYSDVYDSAPRQERRQIARELCHMLTSDGMRFLKLSEEGLWVEERDLAAVEAKIGQKFRSNRKKKDTG